MTLVSEMGVTQVGLIVQLRPIHDFMVVRNDHVEGVDGEPGVVVLQLDELWDRAIEVDVLIRVDDRLSGKGCRDFLEFGAAEEEA